MALGDYGKAFPLALIYASVCASGQGCSINPTQWGPSTQRDRGARMVVSGDDDYANWRPQAFQNDAPSVSGPPVTEYPTGLPKRAGADGGVSTRVQGASVPPALFRNPPGVAPEVTLGTNATKVFVGFPLIYSIAIHRPLDVDAKLDGKVLAPLIVGAQTGSWAKFVTFVVRDNQTGAVQNWPIHLLQTPTSSTLSLDADTSGQLTLFVTPEDAAALAPGSYHLDVWLDTRTGSTDSSWKGVSHRGATVVLHPLPQTPSPNQQCWRALSIADYDSRIKNDSASALATVDASLATCPDQLGCLVRRAGFAEDSKDICLAYRLYGHALDISTARELDAGISEPSWIIGKLSGMASSLPDGGCPGS